MRILIIENQIIQFRLLSEYLTHTCGYDIYPSTDEEYLEFMDYVRVFLNKQYDTIYRDKAFLSIRRKIELFRADLVIMDYVLCGPSIGCSGVYLADKLFDENETDNRPLCCPILFLSRTHSNKDKIMNEYEGFCAKHPDNAFIWLPKGYYGGDVLNEKYINHKIIPSIEKLINQNGKKQIVRRLNMLLSLRFFESEHKAMLMSLSRTLQSDETIFDAQVSNIIDKYYSNKNTHIDEEDYEYIKKYINQ